MRVLIATVTAGGGHLQAGRAVGAAWRQLRPKDRVEVVDVLEFASRMYRQTYVEGYVKLIQTAPELWGLVFRKTDDTARWRRLSEWRRRFARGTNRKFVRRLREFRPDVTISTHYLPAEIVGYLRGKDWQTFATSVVTDFEAHALWIEPSVDLYCVAAAQTADRLVARGVAADKLAVTGIPIAPGFAAPPTRAAARKRLALRADLPVLLVLGGGFGLGPVGGLLKALERHESTLQVLVVTGRNAELRRELALLDSRHAVRVLGFVDCMPELLAAADLVVTKPGGLTTSEALAVGRPLVIIDPIPGQETANSDFLLEHGAAVKLNRPDDLPAKLLQLLDRPRLGALARAARRLGHPTAAETVCEEVLARLPGSRRSGSSSRATSRAT